MERCIDCQKCMPYPKGHQHEGMFYCKDCDDTIEGFTYELALKEEECEAFEPRT